MEDVDMANADVVAMILAGGQGARLGVLTKYIAKPAVPFGSRYRIIDFPLYNGKSIMRYLLPKGTAGFAMYFVSTPSRAPCPPARIIATTSAFAISTSSIFIVFYPVPL